MEDLNEENMRPIICWKCQFKFLLPPNLSLGKCPKCKEINEIILEYSDISKDVLGQLTAVICKNCGKRIMIRIESQYVICANCKSTLLIEKDVYDIRPPEYYNLTPKEYYLLLAKENAFNPYQMPQDSEYYLEPEFERKLVDERFQIEENKREYKTFFDPDNGYDHLFQTVKNNQMYVTDNFLNKRNKNN